MNIFTQIALGFLPAVVLFLVLSLLKKKNRIRNISMLTLFALLTSGSFVSSLVYRPAADTVADGEAARLRLELIYALADEDMGFDIADNLMRALRGDTIQSAEYTECDALLRAQKGDYLGAKALITKAEQLMDLDYAEQLKELCNACIAESGAGGAAGGNSVAQLMSFASEQLKEMLSEGSDAVFKAARVLVASDSLYSDYLRSDTLDEETLGKLVRRMNAAIEDMPALLGIPQIRLCRLKLMVLDGDYKDIAGLIDEDSSYEELAAVSELYINGLVKESDFSDGFADDSAKVYERVAAQVEKAIDKIPEENATEIRDAEKLAKSLNEAADAPALYKVKDSISRYAADESFADRPKAYIQLARVEHYTGNTERAQDCISDSLGSVGICEDDNFTVPMAGIVDTITDKNDPEKLKNVAAYVDAVTSNAADTVVSKAVNEAKDKLEQSGNENGDKDSTKPGNNPEDFGSFMTDYVSQKRVSFNITEVDASEFETVRVTVNVDDSVSITAEELKEMISLTDCGVEITDFTVEKVEYTGANILLCCDVSGSMSGQPIADLREAVTLFADTASDIENLALVSFENSVTGVWGFGSSHEEISSAGASLSGGGGTNMYGAIIESIDKFSVNKGETNFILLLSDGEDNTPHSAEEIMENIGVPAQKRGITLYSLGLGSSVNIDYMNTLASSTGGSFLYVNDSASLSSFYSYLRGQILNRYIVTFKAENTLNVDRELTISLTEDPLTRDTAFYSLRADGDESGYAQSEHIGLEGKGVYGLDTRLVYKSANAVSVKLSGFGFADTDSFSVSLDGDLDYGGDSVKTAYVDENTLNVLLPGGMACGTYDVHVSVNGKTAILKDELTVAAQGQEKTTAFGPYVFTSNQKTESDGAVTLSGGVSMNGWLFFDGSVTLTGDLDGYSITMSDNSGSYVKYYTDTAEGLASYLAKRNCVLKIPALGSVTLYNDVHTDANSTDYEVKANYVEILSLGNLLSLNGAGVELYPNRFEVRSDAFSTKFPFQDSLVKKGKLDSLFNFDVTADGIITNKSIDFRVDVDNSTLYEGNYSQVNLGAMPIYISPDSYKIHIDTLANEYSLEYGTKLAFIEGDGLSLSVEWKQRETDSGLEKLCPSKIELGADIEIDATLGSIPAVYRDFKLSIDDIDPGKSIFDWMLAGSFDLECATASDYLPKLEKWVGDAPLFSFDDVTLKFSFGQAYVSVGAKLKIFDAIQLGEAQIQAGRIPYTSRLLGMNSETVSGMQADLTVGIIWNSNNCDIELTGTTKLSVHSRFAGIETVGKCDINVSWWVFEKAVYEEGQTAIGMYVDHKGEKNFIVKARTNSSAKGSSEEEYYIYWNKDSGLAFETKKL